MIKFMFSKLVQGGNSVSCFFSLCIQQLEHKKLKSLQCQVFISWQLLAADGFVENYYFMFHAKW